MRRSSAVVIAALVVAAVACTGDAAPPSKAASSASPTPATTTAGTEAASATATATATPVATEPAAVASESVAERDAYCRAVRRYDRADFREGDVDQFELRRWLNGWERAARRAGEVAPDDLQVHWEAVADNVRAHHDVLIDAGYNPARITKRGQKRLQNTWIAAVDAVDPVAADAEQRCDITITSG